MDAIHESVEVNGWFGAVVAQKSTGHVLVGNHRLRAAIQRGAKEVPVIWRDVDDDRALRILLADNRTAEMGTYDEVQLEELLSGLETLDGTAYGLDLLVEAEDDEQAEEDPEEGTDEEDPVPDDKYTPEFGVMVVCESEEHQRKVYEELTILEYDLRVVAV